MYANFRNHENNMRQRKKKSFLLETENERGFVFFAYTFSNIAKNSWLNRRFSLSTQIGRGVVP